MPTLRVAETFITMTKRRQILKSLQDQEYRKEFAADIGTGLAFQIRLSREARGWTQEELAQRTGKRQETISQWENPNYGRYTLNTLKDLAAALDVALIVKFAPFSELVDWVVHLTPDRLAPPSFGQENLSSSIASLADHADAPAMHFSPWPGQQEAYSPAADAPLKLREPELAAA